MHLIWSSVLALMLLPAHSAYAEKTGVVWQKKLLYCDFFMGRRTLYMDMYLSYNPVEDIYTNPEVAVFDTSEVISYPGYLWPLSLTFDPSQYQSQIFLDRGPENFLKFSISAIDTGIVLMSSKGSIQPFNVKVDGIFKGHGLTQAVFSCYNVFP